MSPHQRVCIDSKQSCYTICVPHDQLSFVGSKEFIPSSSLSQVQCRLAESLRGYTMHLLGFDRCSAPRRRSLDAYRDVLCGESSPVSKAMGRLLDQGFRLPERQRQFNLIICETDGVKSPISYSYSFRDRPHQIATPYTDGISEELLVNIVSHEVAHISLGERFDIEDVVLEPWFDELLAAFAGPRRSDDEMLDFIGSLDTGKQRQLLEMGFPGDMPSVHNGFMSVSDRSWNTTSFFTFVYGLKAYLQREKGVDFPRMIKEVFENPGRWERILLGAAGFKSRDQLLSGYRGFLRSLTDE